MAVQKSYVSAKPIDQYQDSEITVCIYLIDDCSYLVTKTYKEENITISHQFPTLAQAEELMFDWLLSN